VVLDKLKLSKRPAQVAALETIARGADLLYVDRTGGGKSLAFQWEFFNGIFFSMGIFFLRLFSSDITCVVFSSAPLATGTTQEQPTAFHKLACQPVSCASAACRPAPASSISLGPSKAPRRHLTKKRVKANRVNEISN